MTKIDPILAVKNVDESSKWYQSAFGCRRTHGGTDFAVLVDERDNVLLCLHKWGEHEHPTMKNSALTPGNGLIIYFKTDNLEKIKGSVEKMNYPLETNIQTNQNSLKKEFSLRDPDGYYITVTEYHNYEG